MTSSARYVPHLSFPAYTFVPDRNPHPVSHPQGHSYRRETQLPEASHASNWQNSEHYLFGVDLFNAGFYWEAHEAWEALWLACGRSGPAATFFKGLIKLAAAGVKHAQGMPEGVRGHCLRAAELFSQIGESKWMGLSPRALQAEALRLAESWEPMQLRLDFAD